MFEKVHTLIMNVTVPQSPKQFYRRELPRGCIEFSSEEGKQVFKEALCSGHMDCYFKLAAQFRTQDEPAFCGLSTLVMVLNSLSVDPGKVWKGPWRWYHESMLDCCMSLPLVEKQGITFDSFVCLAECNFLIAQPVRAEENFSEGTFREVVKQVTRQDKSVLVISYSRKVLNQTGDGHFSPIGGYHPGRDLALVLDTARFKYPPHWVPVSTLVTAMRSVDPDTGILYEHTN